LILSCCKMNCDETTWKTVPKPPSQFFWKPNRGNRVFSFWILRSVRFLENRYPTFSSGSAHPPIWDQDHNSQPQEWSQGQDHGLQTTVGAKRGSATGHWSSSARSHHTGTEAASLAQFQDPSTGVQVSSRSHPAVSVRGLSTRHGSGTSAPAVSGRSHLRSPLDTDTARR